MLQTLEQLAELAALAIAAGAAAGGLTYWLSGLTERSTDR